MQSIEKITLVLRPHAGTTIEDLQQYAKLGMPVGVGRSLGVIAGASEGDLMERIEQLENQVILAEAALARNKAQAAGWTDAQVLDFLSVALRHVVVQGDLKYSDINDALKYMADKGKPAFVLSAPFDIVDQARLALDAARYRWLRDVAFDTPRQDLALRDRHRNLLIEAELDAEIDQAMRAYPSEGDQEDWSGPSPETLQALESIASRHPLASAETVDPRNLFASINPIGASADELEQGRNGFVDERTHADYLIFLAGYRAAQEAVQCAD